ncbi:MAG: ABC transporter permease [Spirochaetaceae bacterium]|nr:ABC transporter permease [Spirochaetaceae bacterium]
MSLRDGYGCLDPPALLTRVNDCDRVWAVPVRALARRHPPARYAGRFPARQGHRRSQDLEARGTDDDPWESLGVFIIPSIILGTALSAGTMRITRTMMLEVLRQDYVRTAWAKGLRERMVVLRHAIKNAMIPVLSAIGLTEGRTRGCRGMSRVRRLGRSCLQVGARITVTTTGAGDTRVRMRELTLGSNYLSQNH